MIAYHLIKLKLETETRKKQLKSECIYIYIYNISLIHYALLYINDRNNYEMNKPEKSVCINTWELNVTTLKNVIFKVFVCVKSVVLLLNNSSIGTINSMGRI